MVGALGESCESRCGKVGQSSLPLAIVGGLHLIWDVRIDLPGRDVMNDTLGPQIQSGAV